MVSFEFLSGIAIVNAVTTNGPDEARALGLSRSNEITVYKYRLLRYFGFKI